MSRLSQRNKVRAHKAKKKAGFVWYRRGWWKAFRWGVNIEVPTHVFAYSIGTKETP